MGCRLKKSVAQIYGFYYQLIFFGAEVRWTSAKIRPRGYRTILFTHFGVEIILGMEQIHHGKIYAQNHGRFCYRLSVFAITSQNFLYLVSFFLNFQKNVVIRV
jgi:hypothetical protein